MNPVERSIRRLERRALLAIFTAELLRALAVAVFVAGAAVLLARVVWRVEAAQAAWLFLIVAAAFPVAFLRARRRRLSRAGAAAWQDVRSGASGVLLTALEVPDERWHAQVEKAVAKSAARLPGVRFGGETYAVGAALVFALLSWWVHVPRATAHTPADLLQATVERLAEKLLTMEEDVGLFDETATELAGELERLVEGLDEGTLESAFEAIDRLEERFGDVAERVQEDVLDAEAGLESVLERALADPAGAQAMLEKTLAKLEARGLDENLLASMESLAGTFQRAGLELPDGLRLPEGLELSGEQLRELSSELGELLDGKLGTLKAMGLLSELDLADLKGLGSLEFVEHECDEECEEGGT